MARSLRRSTGTDDVAIALGTVLVEPLLLALRRLALRRLAQQDASRRRFDG